MPYRALETSNNMSYRTLVTLALLSIPGLSHASGSGIWDNGFQAPTYQQPIYKAPAQPTYISTNPYSGTTTISQGNTQVHCTTNQYSGTTTCQ